MILKTYDLFCNYICNPQLFALSSLLEAINSKKEVVLVLELMLGTIFSSYIKHLKSDHAQIKRLILSYGHIS